MSLFFALRLPQSLQARCYAEAQLLLDPGAAFTHVEDYHITLAYLGSYSDLVDQIPAARAAAATVAAVPFGLVLNRAGSFKGKRLNPWWLAPLANGPLVETQSSLVVALAAASVPVDKAHVYNPHLTIGWCSDTLPERPLIPIAWAVTEFELMARLPGDPTYKTLHRFALQARA